MDKRSPIKNGPAEVTRESLISIAYSKPEQVLSRKPSYRNPNSKRKTQLSDAADYDEDDKFRSELIAISYQHSSDTTIDAEDKFRSELISISYQFSSDFNGISRAFAG